MKGVISQKEKKVPLTPEEKKKLEEAADGMGRAVDDLLSSIALGLRTGVLAAVRGVKKIAADAEEALDPKVEVIRKGEHKP